jgi:putative ABC transport system permease protein
MRLERWIYKLHLRLRSLFHRQAADQALDEELRYHLEQKTQQHIAAGMHQQEARRAALLEIGGLEKRKEECRDARQVTWLQDLLQDIHYGLRILRKSPGFTAVAVLTLAFGIGASTLVFSVFYNFLFNAFAAKDAGRLVVPVVQDAENPERAEANLQPLHVHLSDLDFIREQNTVFENIAGYIAGGIVLANDGAQTYQFYDARVSSDAFDFYGVPPLLGRGIVPADGKPSALPVFVISYKTWKGTFNADPSILGKSYIVDGEPRVLIGVMPPRFQAYGSLQQIWLPITWTRGAPSSDSEPTVALLARLKPGVTIDAASADLDTLVKHLAVLHPVNFPKHFSARVESATDYLVGPQGTGPVFFSDIKHLLYDLLAAVLLLLLIACSNVANLLLARATLREKEIAVRSTLGATRGRLVRQLLVESLMLAIAACLLGCIFASFGMKFVGATTPQAGGGASLGGRIGGEIVVGLDLPVLFFAMGITLLTALICGLAPALRVVRSDLQPHLTGSGKGAKGGFRHGNFRAALVIGEVALSIVLLTGAGLMIRSFYLLTHVDLGFNAKNILLVGFIPPPTHGKTSHVEWFFSPQGQMVLRRVVDRLKALPGVVEVAVQDTLPGYGPVRGPEVTVPGATRAEEAGIEGCDENLLHTLDFRLTQGRWLSGADVQNAQYVAVINQRLARDFFGDRNPIGQQLKVKAFKKPAEPPQDAYFQIIGVIHDVISVGPQKPSIPMVFVPTTVRGGFILLVKTTVPPASLMRAVQEQVWAVDPSEIFAVFDPLENFFHRLTYATPEFGVMISAPLAGIGLLLVIVGVFSVMAYTVSLQTREIGIRMALGAQPRRILQMILSAGVRLIAVGAGIGILASYGLTRFLASQIWGVSVTDPWTFGVVVALVVVIGLAASALPARRATRVDPMIALRYE